MYVISRLHPGCSARVALKFLLSIWHNSPPAVSGSAEEAARFESAPHRSRDAPQLVPGAAGTVMLLEQEGESNPPKNIYLQLCLFSWPY